MQLDEIFSTILVLGRSFLVFWLVLLCVISAVVFRRGPIPDLSRFSRRKNPAFPLGLVR